MPKKKIEVYNKDELIYPFIESDHVSFSNGMKVGEMLNQSISMPTVAHEDLSFKVGVGDQDVSSAIVDSSVAKMTIKGKTYQNILPEPSTHVLTNNKEMFKVNEGLDPNVEIVDGVSKSAILKGNTINCLLSANNTPSGAVYDYSRQLEVGETYTIFYNYVVTGDDMNIVVGEARVGTSSTSIPNTAVIDGRTNAGTYIGKKVVTLSNVSSKMLINWIRSGTGTLTVNELYCIQGDYSNIDIPFVHTGLQSVKAPVLTTTGKNLFDVESVFKVNGNTVKEVKNGSVVLYKPPHNSLILETIKVKANTTYTISCEIETIIDGGRAVYGIGGVTENKTAMSDSSGNLALFIRAGDQNSEGEYKFYNIQLEEGTQATPYEPYKSNILSTPEEVVLRSLPNGVCDTLNLNTGEYVQRIEEHVLDGTTNNASRDWNICWNDYSTNTLTFEGYRPTKKLINTNSATTTTIPKNFICDKVKVLGFGSMWQDGQAVDRELSITTYTGGQLIFVIEKSKLTTMDVSGFKQWLSQNPVTIQYELETPIIKTVDLSSSGNWEKVDINPENLYTGNIVNDNVYRVNYNLDNLFYDPTKTTVFSNTFKSGIANIGQSGEVFSFGSKICFAVSKAKTGVTTLDDVKQWFRENPTVVWYQTANHKDSTQVKQPIFFKDGHIQLSSGADNSLIPTLDYQAKTSNSYVMDLMKTNTKYTMKAKSASGTFTIDGASYGAGTNGTFTTPSSMTNKFLVMSNKTNEDVMILEGDVVSKTIPYFKGIKSAFEDESKIEVLSTSQNILDTSKIVQGDLLTNGIIGATGGSADLYCYTEEFIPCPNIKHPLYIHRTIDGVYSQSSCYIFFFDEDKRLLQPRTVSNTFTIPDGAKYLRIMVYKGDVDVSRVGIMVTNSGTDRFNQSVGGLQNSTKIPLLSPLRSLPNGVKDELIIDRANNKVALIQRIGEVVFDGSESLSSWIYNDNGIYKSIRTSVNNCVKVTTAIRDSVLVRCDKYIPIHYNAPWTTNKMVSVDVNGNIVFCGDEIRDTKTWINILKSSPTIVYYQLATPIITEVDLEGFPYIYKDGHIFLNSEIAPTTEITYSINQCQQISASNEDIIRHEKELTYLQKLIAQYVQVDYESALLSLKV